MQAAESSAVLLDLKAYVEPQPFDIISGTYLQAFHSKLHFSGVKTNANT